MKKISKRTRTTLLTFLGVIIAFVICQTMISTGNMKKADRGMMIPICAYIVMAVSLNLTVGISGELSLGHAGFMSIGAFTGAIVSGWLLARYNMAALPRLIISLFAGGITAGIAGILIGIPVLRLRGDYLAIVTLAFGEIIRRLFNVMYVGLGDGTVLSDGTIVQDKLHIRMITDASSENWKLLVNGPAGATGVKAISTFAVGFALVLFALFVVMNLVNSRTGRAIMAARDNRIAAESVGINVTKYKMIAFVTSAALAGMAGALFGLSMSAVETKKFSYNESIQVLVYVVLGGIGNIPGSIVAAAILKVLPEKLRAFNTYRMLIYSIVLIVVMIIKNNPWIKSMTDAYIRKPVRRYFEQRKQLREINKRMNTEGGDGK